MACPVLCVDRIFNDRRIQPKPVSLFTMIEGCFKCRPATASAATTSTTTATSGGSALVVFVGLGRLCFALRESCFQL